MAYPGPPSNIYDESFATIFNDYEPLPIVTKCLLLVALSPVYVFSIGGVLFDTNDIMSKSGTLRRVSYFLNR